MRKLIAATLTTLTILIICGPALAARNAPPVPVPVPINRDTVAEVIQAEAQRLVDGFIAEFPGTLEAMADNPYQEQMDRRKGLLADHRFQGVMVDLARELLRGADIETIIQARHAGKISEKYLKEMMRLSMLFADAVTPLIMQKLDGPDLKTS